MMSIDHCRYISNAALFVCAVVFFSCGEKVPTTGRLDTDTLKVLQAALRDGISDEFMPETSPLKRPYRFGDSILLTTEILPLQMLSASAQHQPFKILPRQQICSMITADSNIIKPPNYLMINRFKKNDTGYYVQVCSCSCQLLAGGGLLGLYFKKVGDSLIITDRTAGSIN